MQTEVVMAGASYAHLIYAKVNFMQQVMFHYSSIATQDVLSPGRRQGFPKCGVVARSISTILRGERWTAVQFRIMC